MSSTGRTLGDNALVAVAAGDLVALLDLTASERRRRARARSRRGPARRRSRAAEAVDVDDAAVGAVRHLEGSVAHLAGLLAEDGAQQALLGGQLGLALRA